MLKLNAWIELPPVEFDDGETVHRLTFSVRQLQLGEAKELVAKGFDRWSNPPSAVLVSRRHDHPDEIERSDDDDSFVMPTSHVLTRRIAEMTADDRASYKAMVAAEVADRQAGILAGIRDHVRLEPTGQVQYQTDAGEVIDVQTGDDIIRAFSHCEQFLHVIWGLFYQANFLNPRKKKRSDWLSSSTTSSDGPSPGPPGTTPGIAAPSAGHEGSVSAAGATGGTDTPSSGALVN